MQVPPVYSALKHQGKPLYEWARAGKPIIKPSRQVQIRHLLITQWQKPWLTLEAKVSKGTYVRSLATDIGQKLGCGGCVVALRRIQAAQFCIDQAINHDLLQSWYDENVIDTNIMQFLQPVHCLLQDFVPVELNSADCISLFEGRSLPSRNSVMSNTQVYFTSQDKTFLGVGYSDQEGILFPKRLVNTELVQF